MRTGLQTLATALMVSSALVVYAQTQAVDPQLTISGCLKQDKASPDAGTPATDSFVLSDVKMGASSPASALGLAPQYEIQGLSDVELQKHINHSVEVTGRISTPAAASSTQQTEPLKKPLPEFVATSIKMLSSTCDAK
jgi:hypothetical protein